MITESPPILEELPSLPTFLKWIGLLATTFASLVVSYGAWLNFDCQGKVPAHGAHVHHAASQCLWLEADGWHAVPRRPE